MKKLFFIFVALCVILYITVGDNKCNTQIKEIPVVEYREEVKPIREETKLLYVVDGDTVKINFKGEDRSLRLVGIDAPESNDYRYGYIEEGGEEAKEYLKSLLYGNDVEIFVDSEEDYYGRLLGTIYIDGVNINNKMVQDGYALYYK